MKHCHSEDCDKPTPLDDPNAVFVYDDPYSEEYVLFCSEDCLDMCGEGWFGCFICKKLTWMDGNFAAYLTPGGETEIVCKRCFAQLLLQNGQQVPEDFYLLQNHCYPIKLFRDITPKEFGYVQVPGFVDLIYSKFASTVTDFIRRASDCIANCGKVLFIESNAMTFHEWMEDKNVTHPLNDRHEEQYKKDTECLTLWCYGLYHNVTRDAVITWMLCAPQLLKQPGYCYPKDIGRLIGKMVYTTRNDSDIWSHLLPF